MMASKRIHMVAVLMAGVACSIAPMSATARDRQVYQFDFPAQDLGEALRAVAAKAGWELYASADDLNGVAAPSLHGAFTAREAIEQLVRGTSLSVRFDKGAVIVRGRSEVAAANGSVENDIIVTGTHIRGGNTASTLISVTRSDIRNAGQVNLGDVARSIPQNFGGGQNPSVGSGAGLINSNLNSSSQMNLRGLGPDATLTLLNGHRLPYDGVFGGIDISAIPVAAVDRLEIVPDGSSAEYGSDAVAGVVNVVLRRDYSGLTTSFRIGGSTDGGNFQQGVDLVGGTSWGSGGFIAAYQFAHNSGIAARQRNYTGALPQANSLYPAIRQHSVIVSGHQTIAPGVEFKIDGLFSDRRSTIISGNEDAGGLTQYRLAPTARSISVTPEIDLKLGAQWMARVSTAFGKDDSHYNTLITPPGGTGTATTGCYCNSAVTAELVIDGPVFSLPAGELRVAFGGGYRSNSMRYTRYQDTVPAGAFNVARKSHYLFGEAEIPVVGPAQAFPLVYRLTLTAAARYENYPGMASVTTPKLGLVYEPEKNLTFRASWGRSFKAPTLYQQYVGYETYLFPTNWFVPDATGTVLYTSGGNPSLTPERARSWSAGLEFHPDRIPGLKINATYFNVRYKDRVVQPIAGSIASAFSDPGYAALLNHSPSAAQLDALIAGSLYGLTNYSDGPFDPANVDALIDNRNRNVARQDIDGVDFGAAYAFAVGKGQKLSLSGSATYLRSDQILTQELPSIQLAGSVFNPPNWRARAGAVWETKRTTVATYVNYIGSVLDARFLPSSRVSSMATMDFSARLSVGGSSAEKPFMTFALTINNLFDAKPDIIRTTGSSDTPYDSTNFSAVGRVIGLTISRSW